MSGWVASTPLAHSAELDYGRVVTRVLGMFRRLSAVLTILALGLLLAGCDKCGDWFWQQRALGLSAPDACKGSLPKP
jgi:hypothetical protein